MGDEFEHSKVPELIILCCHSLYIASTSRGDPTLESAWHLSPFQRSKGQKPGEHETFLFHILSSLLLLHQSRNRWLVISGGCTARDVIDQSEARSYFHACEVLHEADHPCFGKLWDEVKGRVLLEEAATDSYQNLLFSILLLRKQIGRYPSHVTVVTHAFKARRFLELHASVIGWPKKSIAVQGTNPPFTNDELDETGWGEKTRAYEAFSHDPYGARKFLSDKRKSRGWNDDVLESIGQGLEPSIGVLLRWKGGKSGQELFPYDLPWTQK